METVEIKGLRELRLALMRTIPAEMQGKILQKALGPAARLVVNAARANTSKFKEPTGRLRKAIYASRDKDSKPTFEARVVAVRKGRKRSDLRGAYYWRFVEFGHRVGSRKTGKLQKLDARGTGRGAGFRGKTSDVPAQPFLRPAFDANKYKAASLIRDKLGELLAAAAKKASW